MGQAEGRWHVARGALRGALEGLQGGRAPAVAGAVRAAGSAVQVRTGRATEKVDSDFLQRAFALSTAGRYRRAISIRLRPHANPSPSLTRPPVLPPSLALYPSACIYQPDLTQLPQTPDPPTPAAPTPHAPAP